MRGPLTRICLGIAFLGITVVLAAQVDSQEPGPFPGPAQGPPPMADAPPEVPNGVEVMARGPVHEAFASPSQEAKATQPVPKKPPTPIEEMAPEDRPEGDVAWIGGYWAYDDERQDFLWVSGCWRVKPEHKEWVPGYWREVGTQWQWVAGFWANAAADAAGAPTGQVQDVTYYPDPPAPPNVAAPGDPPSADMFAVPGYWQWTGTHYVWRPGYFTRVRPGYVYVPAHYRWTPSGYVFIPGYWDYAVARRGVIYAPVVVNTALMPVNYVYTPVYAVPDTLVLDAMFVRPAYGCYYFGDYYGPQYANRGYVTTVVYSRTYYEPIVVYQRWEYRDNPRWYSTQVNIVFERNAGRMPVPPRTLVQQQTIINNTTVNNNYYTNNQTTVNNTNVNNTTVNNTKVNNTNVNNTTVNNTTVRPAALAPAKTLMAARGIPTTKLDTTTRAQVTQTAKAVQVAAVQRAKTELAPAPAAGAGRPRTAALSVPTTPVAPKAPATQAVTRPAGTNSGTPSVATPNTLSKAPVATPPNTLGKAPLATPPSALGNPAGGVKGVTPATTPNSAVQPKYTPGTATQPTTAQPKYAPATNPAPGTPMPKVVPGTTTPALTPFIPVRPGPPAAKKADEKKKDR